MQQTTEKRFADLEINAFELVSLDSSFYWERILVIGCQYVNKESQDFRYYWNRTFGEYFFSERSKNLTRKLYCIFKQSFEPLNILTVHKSSDTGVLSHLSNPAFFSL